MERLIYTDGSCIGRMFGYAVYFVDSKQLFTGCGYNGTNQLAEMMAIELAVKMAEDNDCLIIHTDSAFAMRAITRNWNLSKSPHLEECRARIREAFLKRNVHGKFVKVTGHSGDTYNELVDKHSRLEAERLAYP